MNGTIVMSGGSKDVNLQSVNGSVEVTSPATRVHAEAVNGAVTVRDASGEVDASTVNGTLTVVGGTFTRAQLETVSGRIVFEGALGKGATLSAETVSGSVDLTLPASVSADFSISSFSGEHRERARAPRPRRPASWTSEKELSFTSGTGRGKVSVETLSGNIRLHKRP